MRIILALPILISACTPFPALEGTISDAARRAPYPTLSPLPDLQAATESETFAFQNRLTALQVRAARLRNLDITALQ